jgi:hypothetical protein
MKSRTHKPKFDRKRVFYDAKRFALVGVPYPVALKEAWRAEKFRVLKRLLATGVVEFQFQEAGKQVQRIVGTTMPHLLPADQRVAPKSEMAYVRVYDTTLEAWRKINSSTSDIEFV